jgi:hypothetical protein
LGRRAEATPFLGGEILYRPHDDRDFTTGACSAETPQELEPVHSRHEKIEHHESGTFICHMPKSRLAVL